MSWSTSDWNSTTIRTAAPSCRWNSHSMSPYRERWSVAGYSEESLASRVKSMSSARSGTMARARASMVSGRE